MTVYEKGLTTVLACDLLFVLISIPLILRKVPRNTVYGYRTPSTLGDDFIWYEANAYFAKRFVLALLASAIVLVPIALERMLSPQSFLTGSVVFLVAPIAITIALTMRFIRKLKESHRGAPGTS